VRQPGEQGDGGAAADIEGDPGPGAARQGDQDTHEEEGRARHEVRRPDQPARRCAQMHPAEERTAEQERRAEQGAGNEKEPRKQPRQWSTCGAVDHRHGPHQEREQIAALIRLPRGGVSGPQDTGRHQSQPEHAVADHSGERTGPGEAGRQPDQRQAGSAVHDQAHHPPGPQDGDREKSDAAAQRRQPPPGQDREKLPVDRSQKAMWRDQDEGAEEGGRAGPPSIAGSRRSGWPIRFIWL